MLSSSKTDWYVGPGSPAVAASQTGSCTPLHNVLFQTKRPGYWSETSWTYRLLGSVIRRLPREMTCALWTLTSALLGLLDEIWWEFWHGTGYLGGVGAQAIGSDESVQHDWVVPGPMPQPIEYVFPYIQAISQLCSPGLWDLSVESSNITFSWHWRWKERSVTCISKISSDMQDSTKYICAQSAPEVSLKKLCHARNLGNPPVQVWEDGEQPRVQGF